MKLENFADRTFGALVPRNYDKFSHKLFAKKYDNQSQSNAIEKQSKGNRIQSNTIERQSNAIKFFQFFSIFN